MKKITYIFIITIFFSSVIYFTPSWVLAHIIAKASDNKLQMYDETGSFWQGEGLLVLHSRINQKDFYAPLIYLNWNLVFNFSKLLEFKFSSSNKDLAQVYLKHGAIAIDNLSLWLSVDQTSNLMELIKDMSLAGSLEISAKHLLLGKFNSGQLLINFNNISSGIAPINPLGSYQVLISLTDQTIKVTSAANSTIILTGDGNMTSLNLKASIIKDKIEQLTQFITLLGMPNSDGSYQLKVF